MPASPPPNYNAAAILRASAIDEVIGHDFPQALEMAKSAIKSGLVHARFYWVVAFELEDARRYDDAVKLLEKGLRLEPENVDLLMSIGFCLFKLRDPDAERVFRLALDLDPTLEAARFGLGSALRMNLELAEAEAELRQVLLMNPTHTLALGEIAEVAFLRGDFEAAREYVDRALEGDPSNGGILLVDAKLKVVERDFAGAEASARASLSSPGLEPDDQAEAKLVIADALDGLGKTHEAFAAYVDAKALTAKVEGPKIGVEAREPAIVSAKRIMDAFLATPAERWAAKGEPPSIPAKGHAFLVGFPRSGTTLLENVLASHPDVVSLEERPTLVEATRAYLVHPEGLDELSRAGEADLDRLRAAYWEKVRSYGVDPTGKVFIDKHPLGAVMTPIIAKLFPEAKILFALRDPRDVVFSCFRRGFKMNLPMYEFTDLERAARFYDVVMSAKDAFFQHIPLAVHTVRYERLVVDFDAEAKAAVEFLGLEWTEAMRDFAKTAKSKGVRTRSASQVTQSLNTQGLAQWRRYEFALEPVQPILAPWVKRYGYTA